MAFIDYIPNSVPVDPDLGKVPPVPSVRGNMFEPTVVCCKCRMPCKESASTTFRGKVYGVTCGCAGDIVKLASGGK